MSPTSTEGLPPAIACAAGALICCMSHCSGDSESLSVAGVLGSGAAGPASVAAEVLSRSCTAKPAVEDAFWIRESSSRFARNVSLVDDATATPICG